MGQQTQTEPLHASTVRERRVSHLKKQRTQAAVPITQGRELLFMGPWQCCSVNNIDMWRCVSSSADPYSAVL